MATGPRSKFALPDIEHEPPHRPSRASTITTNRELARREGVERSKAATAAANARAAKARAEAAEARARARADTPPVAAKPEGAGASLSDVKQGVQRTFRKTPQKALVAELVAVVVLTAVREVANGDSPGIEPFVGSFVVYLILGFAAEVGGEQTARVAAGIGALVLLAVAARTVGPLVKASRVVANPQVAPLAGPGSGVRTMGPQGSHRRPPGSRLRGNNLNNPTGG